MQQQNNRCNICGADNDSGGTCREKFEECLALEYEYPQAYGAVHFLLVGCYMLQHNEYSRGVWLEMRNLIEKYLNGELSTAQIRKQFRVDMDSGKREFHITRGEKFAEFGSIQWGRTIAGIRLDSPEQYVEDVIHWAESIVADTACIMEKHRKEES
jgi:hypothetical protein